MASVEIRIRGKLSGEFGNQSPLKPTAKGMGCGIRSKRQTESMTVEITLRRELENEAETEQVEQEVKDALNLIKAKIESGELELIENSNADVIKVEVGAVTSGCPEGSEESDDGTACFVCPPGTEEKNGKCEDCVKNYYQDLEGQTQCYACPTGTGTAQEGSYSGDCSSDPTEETVPEMLPIIIGVVVAVVVVLIIIIVIIVVCMRKKKSSSGATANGRNGTNGVKSYDNETFEAEPEYSEINEKKMEGHYEQPLPVKKDANSPYAGLN